MELRVSIPDKPTQNPSYGRVVLAKIYNPLLSGPATKKSLICETSLLIYNSRMDQTTKWWQAILNCMKKEKLNI